MRVLSIDIETFSSVDLTKCGVYKYTESEDFEILLFGYAFDDEEVRIVDLAQNEKLPIDVIEAIFNPRIIKAAFNAQFERTCLSKYFNKEIPLKQWRCSMVHALTLGLPRNLESVARCLNLETQKMDEGKALIRYFSIPCKPTKTNGDRTRNLPEHDIEKWELFKKYCKRDVEVEREIRRKIENYPMTDKELKLWFLDQKINDYGVKVDKELVENAIECDEGYQKVLMGEALDLTGLDNPNSPAQLNNWLKEKGIEVDSLSKANVEELLDETDDSIVKRMLELRQEMSKTSVKKYEAMDRAMCSDERIKGLLQFYGAITGRWTGRLVQVHNLPRNDMDDLDLAREILLNGDYETLEILFDSIPDVLSQLSSMIIKKNNEVINVTTTNYAAMVFGITAKADTNLNCNITITGKASEDCSIKILFSLDGVYYDFKPIQKLAKGDNVIGLPLPMPQVTAGDHTFMV
ncbi:hypothetical protein KQI42_17910 [Tissierella sp. MSJ-40]|uniref:DNA polymerase n=1 Tax=Tissierella simiarum TaxID=2841534 RepID=A0ABS6EAD3_9FIRM|nr:hypothetical protein [Tissierella simiarum]MBU5439890.1 hypothetical protein [Tissierella simiarum]